MKPTARDLILAMSIAMLEGAMVMADFIVELDSKNYSFSNEVMGRGAIKMARIKCIDTMSKIFEEYTKDWEKPDVRKIVQEHYGHPIHNCFPNVRLISTPK